jgi:CheY-like chemotaxis protein
MKEDVVDQKIQALLLVDDEERILALLKRQLSRWCPNLRVVTATSGEEALRSAGDVSFEAVLTDVNMPGMDGIELVQQLRVVCTGIEYCFMTGSMSREQQDRIESLYRERLSPPAVKWLEKPFGVHLVMEWLVEVGLKDPTPLLQEQRKTL